MEIKEQTKLLFTDIEFPFVELKSKQRFVESEDNKVQVNIKPRYFFPDKSNDEFKIVMNVELFVDDHFELKIIGIGTFKLSKDDLSAQEKKMFINGNSTAIMFPYVRALISTITANVGKVTTPIMLPARFFKGDIEELKGREKTQMLLGKVSKKTKTQ